MKAKSELIVSAVIAVIFFGITTASSNGNGSSSLEKRLSSDIQEKAEIGYDIIEKELGNMKELISVGPSKLTYRNFEDNVLMIYKDETGLAVLKESIGIANVLSLQLEELTFSYNLTNEEIEVVLTTGRSITHSSGVKKHYSGSASGSVSISD